MERVRFESLRRAAFCGLLLLLILAPQLLSAQEDTTRIVRDTMRIQPPLGFNPAAVPMNMAIEVSPVLVPPRQLQVGNLPSYAFRDELHLPYHVDNSPLFRGDYTTGGALWSHRSGAIFGSGSQETVPGIGRFNNASLGYMQMFGNRVSLSLSANAMKVNMFPYIGNEFSTSGRLNFQATDRLGFHVFGTKTLGYSPFNMDSYGASMSLVMSDHFKMEVGAQRYLNPMTNRWETVPVLIPTYRFDNGVELGLDVGGIIYEILRNATYKPERNGGNPTIAPPKLYMPMR